MGGRRALRSAAYAVRRGLQGMRETPRVQVLAVFTTAVCMLLLGSILLAWVNVRGVFGGWGIDVPVSVYLAEDFTDDAEVEALVERLSGLPEVERIEHVTPQRAWQRLADGLGSDASALEGIDASILPHSLEVHLVREVSSGFADALAERLAAVPGVEDVALAGAWAQQARTMLTTLGTLALGAASLVALAGMAIIWSTIRLAVYARRSEVQILRLVGGTALFVRGPFIVEGALQGALGAASAMGLLALAFDALQPFVSEGLSFVFAAGSLRFFSPAEVAMGVGFGALVGTLGARAAAGRYVEL